MEVSGRTPSCRRPQDLSVTPADLVGVGSSQGYFLLEHPRLPAGDVRNSTVRACLVLYVGAFGVLSASVVCEERTCLCTTTPKEDSLCWLCTAPYRRTTVFWLCIAPHPRRTVCVGCVLPDTDGGQSVLAVYCPTPTVEVGVLRVSTFHLVKYYLLTSAG